MISLNILMDFCASWYWWWILPFLLGILMGYVIWARFKVRAQELENSVARYKSTVSTLESDLSKSRNDRIVAEAKLTKIESTLNTKEKQVNILNKEVLELKKKGKTASGAGIGFNLKDKEASPKLSGMIRGVGLGTVGMGTASGEQSTRPEVTKEDKKEDKKSKNEYKHYHKFLPTNLQIIEGIGPKLEGILKENGIGTWKELSSNSRGELRALLETYGSRYSIIDPSGWPLQAFKAMNKDWEGLVKIQTEDGSDSKVEKVAKKLGFNKGSDELS